MIAHGGNSGSRSGDRTQSLTLYTRKRIRSTRAKCNGAEGDKRHSRYKTIKTMHKAARRPHRARERKAKSVTGRRTKMQNMEMIDVISEIREVVATLRIIGTSIIGNDGSLIDYDLLSDSVLGQANHLEKIANMAAKISSGEGQEYKSLA